MPSPDVDGRQFQRQEPIGWIREVVLNSPDPERLAGFWSDLVGGEPVRWYDGWWTLEPPPHGQRLSFQGSAPGDSEQPVTSVHFDILVDDLDRAHQRVLAVGGRLVGERWSPRPAPDGTAVPWRVYVDPDGHEFCLVVR